MSPVDKCLLLEVSFFCIFLLFFQLLDKKKCNPKYASASRSFVFAAPLDSIHALTFLSSSFSFLFTRCQTFMFCLLSYTVLYSSGPATHLLYVGMRMWYLHDIGKRCSLPGCNMMCVCMYACMRKRRMRRNKNKRSS